MTEASYTAWDDKQYVWPPPDGWYQAADEKWWPEGYGPPQPEPAAGNHATHDLTTSGIYEQAAETTDMPIDDAASDSARTDEADRSSDFDRQPTGATAFESDYSFEAPEADLVGSVLEGNDVQSTGEAGFSSADVDQASGGDPGDRSTASVGIDAPVVGDLPGPANADAAAFGGGGGGGEFERTEQDDLGPDGVETGLGDLRSPESGDLSMPGLGDLRGPESGDLSMPGLGDLRGPESAGPPDGSIPSTADADLGGPPAAQSSSGQFGQVPIDQTPGPESVQAGFGAPPAQSYGARVDTGPDPDIVLDTKPSGSRSKTLWLVLLGVLALAAVGAAAFLAMRGDGSSAGVETEATGPGSVNEPHPRSTGVVVFYPDGGTDQRWVVEVLEPVRDATSEIVDGGGSAPADGELFAVTRIRIRNEGGVDGASLGDLSFNAVEASGQLIRRQDHQCSAPFDDLDYDASVGLGTQVEGNICWAIPEAALLGLKLGIESSKVAGRVHIALQ